MHASSLNSTKRYTFCNFAVVDREEKNDDELSVLSSPPSSFETVDFSKVQSNSVSEQSSMTENILESHAGSCFNLYFLLSMCFKIVGFSIVYVWLFELPNNDMLSCVKLALIFQCDFDILSTEFGFGCAAQYFTMFQVIMKTVYGIVRRI